jgi:hypothetical protein
MGACAQTTTPVDLRERYRTPDISARGFGSLGPLGLRCVALATATEYLTCYEAVHAPVAPEVSAVLRLVAAGSDRSLVEPAAWEVHRLMRPIERELLGPGLIG